MRELSFGYLYCEWLIRVRRMLNLDVVESGELARAFLNFRPPQDDLSFSRDPFSINCSQLQTVRCGDQIAEPGTELLISVPFMKDQSSSHEGKAWPSLHRSIPFRPTEMVPFRHDMNVNSIPTSARHTLRPFGPCLVFQLHIPRLAYHGVCNVHGRQPQAKSWILMVGPSILPTF